MPSAESLDLVKSILRNAAGALVAPSSFSAWLTIPLTQSGKLLGGAERPDWVLLVLSACDAASGNVAAGARVAAAVETFMAALDLLDEIEDGDTSPTAEAAGVPQALNVATTLLLLGQRLLLELPSSDVATPPLEFARILADGGITATIGQHSDLASTAHSTGTHEEALATARQKAGALASAACRLGAMVGTADPAILDLYSRWGMHFGTVAQLANDLHDSLDTDDKSDIARGKGTLPLVFNQRAAAAADVAQNVATSGALHFTWVVVEIERQACRDLVEQLASHGQNVTALRQLVS